MRTASICPAFFPEGLDSTKTNWIYDRLTIWVKSFQEKRFEACFSTQYADRIQKWSHECLNDYDKNRFRDILAFVSSIASMRPSMSAGKGTHCLCSFSNKSWTETFEHLRTNKVYVVAIPSITDSCKDKNIIDLPEKLDTFREFPWLFKFRNSDWYLIPVDGAFSFHPQKKWETTDFRISWPEYNERKGYLDENNRLWVYDRKEKHWDVYSKHDAFYNRITPNGRQLPKKPVRLRVNRRNRLNAVR